MSQLSQHGLSIHLGSSSAQLSSYSDCFLVYSAKAGLSGQPFLSLLHSSAASYNYYEAACELDI